jgi:hypothetical protein
MPSLFDDVEGSIALAQIHSTEIQLFGHLSPILPAGGYGTTSIEGRARA